MKPICRWEIVPARPDWLDPIVDTNAETFHNIFAPGLETPRKYTCAIMLQRLCVLILIRSYSYSFLFFAFFCPQRFGSLDKSTSGPNRSLSFKYSWRIQSGLRCTAVTDTDFFLGRWPHRSWVFCKTLHSISKIKIKKSTWMSFFDIHHRFVILFYLQALWYSDQFAENK